MPQNKCRNRIRNFPGVGAVVRAWLLIGLIALGVGGCGTIGYYSQSVTGQIRILAARRPVSQVLNDPRIPETDKSQLRLLNRILTFAHEQLLLPDNGSYTTYVRMDRPYVVWNVFAAPEFSLEPVRWCYLIVGCLDYRGYFKREAALSFASGLRTQGYDVFVGGVTAYSTLGWFRDPILSTMLHRSPAELAQLIFHELAHQKLYFPGDTEFNEAFADAVATIGTHLWLAPGSRSDFRQFVRSQKFQDRFTELVLGARHRLHELYKESIPAAEMRARKAGIMRDLREHYEDLKARSLDAGTFDGWFAGGLNNAKFAAFTTYRQLVPRFLRVYRACGDNLQKFYAVIGKMKHDNRMQRRRMLRQLQPAEC